MTAMVDVATLTGACIVALGPDVAGLFTPSDTMAAQLTAASKVAGAGRVRGEGGVAFDWARAGACLGAGADGPWGPAAAFSGGGR